MKTLLEVYIAVIEENSFTKAAHKLHMTQPAVSQSIQKIEAHFGHPLLERSHKTFRMNEAGKLVYQYAKDILLKYNNMDEAVKALEEMPSGYLKIGVSYTIGEYFLPKVLSELVATYPNIQPHVVIHNTDEVKRDLLNEKIDIALVEGEIFHDRLEVQPFKRDKLCVVGKRQYLSKTKLTPKMLESYPWIIREEGSGTRKLTEAFFKVNKMRPEKIYTLGSIQIIKATISSGLGLSILSEISIEQELLLKNFVKIPVVTTPLERSFYIVKRKDAFVTKKTKVFEAIVHRIAQEI